MKSSEPNEAGNVLIGCQTDLNENWENGRSQPARHVILAVRETKPENPAGVSEVESIRQQSGCSIIASPALRFHSTATA